MSTKMLDVVNSDLRTLYVDHLHDEKLYVTESGNRKGTRANYPSMYDQVNARDSILDGDGIDKSRVFVWSDQHFFHSNIIKYANRPFADVDEMHSVLLANYKAVVRPNDICIWVGDVGFAKDPTINHMLDAYPGYKILIAGNHDFGKRKKLRDLNFDEIHLTLAVEFPDNLFLGFTHFPLEDCKLPNSQFTNLGVDVRNVHGHTHDKTIESDYLFSACVEMIDYTPVSLSSIVSTRWSENT